MAAKAKIVTSFQLDRGLAERFRAVATRQGGVRVNLEQALSDWLQKIEEQKATPNNTPSSNAELQEQKGEEIVLRRVGDEFELQNSLPPPDQAGPLPDEKVMRVKIGSIMHAPVIALSRTFTITLERGKNGRDTLQG